MVEGQCADGWLDPNSRVNLWTLTVQLAFGHFCLLQDERFNGLIRPYTAEQVVSKRGTMQMSYPSNVQAKKLYQLLKQKAAKGEVSHTYGA